MSFRDYTPILKLVFVSIFFARFTAAFPLAHAHSPSLSTGQTTEVNSDFVSANLLRPALFTRAIYCGKNQVTKWVCEPCKALGSDIHVIKWGGDNNAVPNYIIAHDNSTNTIVVAHRGTSTKSFLSMFNDVQIKHVDLDKSIFKQPAKIRVHYGFQNTFKHTASDVLTEVKEALAEYKSQSVLIAGHSLGATIATLDAVMLREQLDPSVKITVVVFGLPRMGNEQWANYVDSTIGPGFHRVTDRKDPVVNLPPQLLHYHHPSGEIHIEDVNTAGQATKVVKCPGQENIHCSAGNSVIHAILLNHRGPYFENISFKCKK
ncbi:alpha/beta-hydrolase [Lentinula aff. lateritia]|uniref:Alpha/beta-hydrolase n=1 Tax=Lentinula aff. lateritia TaxID=2804960 RepID=A0ACC1UE99_9AGAR|nr:alpha/beta-hydrolase [Lentinula aff. lateritia]